MKIRSFHFLYIFFIFVSIFLLSEKVYAVNGYVTGTLGGSGEWFCDIPPYNGIGGFGSYKLGIAPDDGSFVDNTTTGTGICTGSLQPHANGGQDPDYGGQEFMYLTMKPGSNFGYDDYGYTIFQKIQGDGTQVGDWVVVNPDPNTVTHIDWINPPEISPSATTTSRTINFQFRYYLNPQTHPTNNSNTMLLQLCPLSYPDDPCQREVVSTTLSTNTLTSVSHSATTERDGFYLGIVSFWNGVTDDVDCPWWNPFCTDQEVIITYSNDNRFNVATTTIDADIPPVIQTLFGQCEGGFFDNPICNTIVYLFYPSANSLQYFDEAKNQFRTKLPFALLYTITGSAFEATSTTTPTIGTDVVVHIDVLGNAETTIFSWQAAKDFFDNTLGTEPMEILVMIAWIGFCVYISWRISTLL